MGIPFITPLHYALPLRPPLLASSLPYPPHIPLIHPHILFFLPISSSFFCILILPIPSLPMPSPHPSSHILFLLLPISFSFPFFCILMRAPSSSFPSSPSSPPPPPLLLLPLLSPPCPLEHAAPRLINDYPLITLWLCAFQLI